MGKELSPEAQASVDRGRVALFKKENCLDPEFAAFDYDRAKATNSKLTVKEHAAALRQSRPHLFGAPGDAKKSVTHARYEAAFASFADGGKSRRQIVEKLSRSQLSELLARAGLNKGS